MESYPYQREDVERLREKADALELSRKARMRLERISFVMEHGGNISQTSRHFGDSRSTIYALFNRFDPKNPASLEDQSKAPKHVPQPETDDRTIALIRDYRRNEPLLSKEKISERLRAEHGIELSASTVGRIINRHGFYFADTPLHRAKRDGHGTGQWQQAAAVAIAITGASLLVDVQPAHALEGTSYEIVPTYDPVEGSLVGGSFTIDSGTISDLSQVTQGATYQTTPAGAASSSTSSSSSSVSSESATTSSAAGNNGKTGGGRRTIPIPESWSGHFTAPTLSSSSHSVAPPALPFVPSAPAELQFGKGIDTLPQVQLNAQMNSAAPSTPSTQRERHALPLPSGAKQQSSISHATTPLSGQIPVLPASVWTGTTVWTTALLLLGIVAVAGRTWIRRQNRVRTHLCVPFLWKRKKASMRALLCAALIAAGLLGALLWTIESARASTTVPLKHWYQGHLLNSDGSAVTSAVTIRFSEWKSADFTASDLTATGSINTAAANYVNWFEEHTLTPSTNGSFAVELGTTHALPDFSTLPPAILQSLYLQVEVKTSGAAEATYDLLDANTSDTAIDRTSILSLPFARNADLLDQHDVGTGSGAIPVLSSGASLSLNGDLTINADVEARDAVLTFGNTILNETLKFSAANSRFEFSDDVHVAENLTASGSMVVEGAVSFGSTIKIGGITYTFPASDASGSGKVLMSDGNGTLTWGAVGSGNLALRTEKIAVTMNDVTVEADGTNNSANVFAGSDTDTNNHQYYTVKTGSGQLQDLTLKIKVRLPSDFVDFGAANDIRFSYKTSGASSADSKVDILVEDNDGDDAFNAADGQGLFNTPWTDYTDEFDQGSFDPAADEFMYVTVKAYTTSGNQPYVGEIVLTYRAR